jgi:hypothetical protein
MFSRWPVRQLTKLAFSIDLRKLESKSPLISQGDKATDLFVVVQGSLKCTTLQTVAKDPYTTKKQRELRHNRDEDDTHGNGDFTGGNGGGNGGNGGSVDESNGGSGAGHNDEDRMTAKCCLEICNALSLVGLESIVPARFPSYACDVTADVDSQVLRIPIEDYHRLLRATRNEMDDGFVSADAYNLMVETLPALREYATNRAKWWELRRDFVSGYHDVNCVLSVDLQTRHYHRPCGRCGKVGHTPTDDSNRCKLGGVSMVSEVLRMLTGSRVKSTNASDAEEEEARKKQRMADLGLDVVMEKALLKKSQGEQVLDYHARKKRREQLAKQMESRMSLIAPAEESPESRRKLLNAARKRLGVEAVKRKGQVPQTSASSTTITTMPSIGTLLGSQRDSNADWLERKLQDALGNAVVPSPPPPRLGPARKTRRPKVWNALSKSSPTGMPGSGDVTGGTSAPAHSQEREGRFREAGIEKGKIEKGKDVAERTASQNLRASLNLKHRDANQAPLSCMLLEAYPQLTELKRRQLKGLAACHMCGEPGHHVSNCPRSGNSNLDARRARMDILHASISMS